MELLSTFSILILSCVVLIYFWLKNRMRYWENKGVAAMPPSLLWGNQRDAIFQKKSVADRMLYFYQFFKSRGLKHGGIYFLWDPMYVTIDLDVVKSILQSDFQHFVDRGIYYNEKYDPLSAHLFSLAGKKWKLLRHKLTPTFTSGKMKMMFETLVDCTDGLQKVMDKDLENAVDIKDVLGRFSTDVIGSCAFGIDCNSLENPDSEFRLKGKRLFEKSLWESVKSFFLFMLPKKISAFLKIRQISKEVDDFFMGVVKENVEYREKNNISRKDFMHLLIQLKNEGKLIEEENLSVENITEEQNNITIQEIAAQAFIFFEAGFETSSTTMTFCLYELAKNMEIQETLRAEIKKVLAVHDNQLTYETVMDMIYLDQIISETMRKYPPLCDLIRICTKEYHVPGTDIVLEKGVRVLIPVYGIHHDPDYHPDPEKFDPDRFSVRNKKNIPAFSYLPFGEGPRACIGARFGTMQTKVGLLALLLKYEFSVNQKTQEPIKFDKKAVVLSTEGGIWLNVKKIGGKTVELIKKK